MSVFGTVLAELCQKEWHDRDDDDIIIIERILLLIRNILHITSDPVKEKVSKFGSCDITGITSTVYYSLHVFYVTYAA